MVRAPRGAGRARLLAAGFAPEDAETIVVGRAAPLATEPRPPAGVDLRAVTAEADLQRIADLSQAIWGEDRTWIVPILTEEIELGSVIVVAEAGAEAVSSGRVRLGPGG